jgi:hypothetical protein
MYLVIRGIRDSTEGYKRQRCRGDRAVEGDSRVEKDRKGEGDRGVEAFFSSKLIFFFAIFLWCTI